MNKKLTRREVMAILGAAGSAVALGCGDSHPGWYQGRATHIHVEVVLNGRSVKATQIAFPESINNSVHTQGVYARRGTNPMSNAADGIFADSLTAELVTPSGSPSSGFTASFQIGVSV